MRTSENAVKAKFAESPKGEVRRMLKLHYIHTRFFLCLRPAKKKRSSQGFVLAAAKRFRVQSPLRYLIATLPKERGYGTVLVGWGEYATLQCP